MKSYTPIDFSAQDFVIQKDAFDVQKEFTRLCPTRPNSAYVFIGETNPFLLLALFDVLRNTASEVVWRESPEGVGVVIFSLPEDEEPVRPSWVIFEPSVSDEAYAQFLKRQKEDTEKTLHTNLAILWKKACTETKKEHATIIETLPYFLPLIYGYGPEKESVHLSGSVPAPALLLAYQWFLTRTKKLFFNERQAPWV